MYGNRTDVWDVGGECGDVLYSDVVGLDMSLVVLWCLAIFILFGVMVFV